MSEPNNETSTYFNEIGGDAKGILGDVSGGTINQYIITQKTGIEIQNQKLISGSPYLGLSKFEAKDKDKFFGRDQWIIKLTGYLTKADVLLLLGASGSGKSSLIQAGLIPALDNELGANQLVVLTFVPDVNPFESFYICLVANSYTQTEAKLARLVEKDTLINVVTTLKKDAQWLIFIDQFEELFTRTPKKERDIFIQSLISLIEAKDNSIKIVFTMRADFLDKLSPYAHLGKIHDNYSLMLTDMDDVELRLAIAEPAARNGVIFEQGLVDTIIADFHQQAGSLPLLQYTLDLLWKNDEIQDHVLNTKTYQDLGGVTGALQQQANTIYAQFNEQERKIAEQIFLELIELVGKEPVNRRVDKTSLEQDVMQKEVLYQLIDNRLLVSKGEGGMATVEVAHEKLLRCWKVLQGLIREKEEIIVLRNRLYADAKQWDELRQQDTQKAKSELWSGSKLARILEFKNNDSLPNLDPVARDFINASVTQGERQKNEKIRTAQRIAASSLVALLISTGLGLMAWIEQRKAKLSEAESLGRESLSVFNEGKELDAFVAAVKGGKILQKQRQSNPEVINSLQTVLAEGRELNRLEGHDAPVRSVSFSPDGKTLASGSADKTIKLWNLETGKEIRTLQGHNGPVRSVNFSPDGKTLASGSADKTNKLWNLETGEEIRTIQGHDGYVLSLSFSPDSKTLASGSFDRTIKLWNLETGTLIHTLWRHNDEVRSVNFSPDGKTLASGSADNMIRLWNLETGKEIQTLQGHDESVWNVSFSPNGKTLASGSDDKTIKLWNLETGKEIRTLQGHNEEVRSVSFSPDGKILASGGFDKTIKLWNLETGKEIRTLQGHNGYVLSLSFSPDSKTLASASADKTIKLWNRSTGWDLDALMGRGCDRVRNYLENNTNKSVLSESDRHLCDGVGTKQ
jgi:WD40 repeat protein/energy-coupling factor transporter ATP-binding protein EcfA2